MKKFSRKITAACFAAVLAVSSMTASVFASPVSPEYSVSVFDTTKKGSITIHKYINNSGTSTDGTGTDHQTVPSGSTPVAGSIFYYIRLSDLEQKGSQNSSSLYATSVNEFFLAKANAAQLNLNTVTIDGKICYYPDEIKAALRSLNTADEQSVRTMIRQNGKAMPETNASGVTTLQELPLGLYLVAETNASAASIPSSPFIASLPMPNLVSTDYNGVTYEPGSLWQYDISVYPKSQSVGIRTEILSADETSLSSKADVQIGSQVKFLVTSDVPVLSSESGTVTNRKYIISNEMSSGMTYSSNLTVSYGTQAPTASTLIKDTDYELTTPTSGNNTVEVALTAAGLAKLNAVTQESHIYVKYTAMANRNLQVGADTNSIVPTLLYGTSRTGDSSITGQTAALYTYQIDMTKRYTETVTDYSKAVFQIRRGGTILTFAREGNGIYHISDGTENGDTLTQNVSPAATDGLLSLKGLSAGSYLITETATAAGFGLMKTSLTVSMLATSPAGVGLSSAALIQDGSTMAITNPLTGGHVTFTITDTKGITLPHTGGSGTAMFAAAGTVFLLAALSMVFFVMISGKRRASRK